MQLSIHFIYLHMTPQAAMLKSLPCLKRLLLLLLLLLLLSLLLLLVLLENFLCYTELSRVSVLNISPHILNVLGLHMVIKLDLQFDAIM